MSAVGSIGNRFWPLSRMKVITVFGTIILGFVLLVLASVPVHAQIQPTDKVSELEEFATALVTIKSTQERERLLSQKKDLMTPDLRKALIQKGNIHLANGQYSTAFDIYGLAKNIARQIGDTEGIATASLDIGTVYYFQANYPAALQHYREARELFTEITNNYESAKALSGVGLIYREQRRDADALQTFQQALTEFTALNDRVEMANTLNSIGVIYYGQGDYAAAAEAFRRSEDALKSAENMARLADSLYMQGDYAAALDFYKQTLSWLSPTEIGATIAALNGAANSSYFQGDYDQALEYFQRDIVLQQKQPDKTGLAAALKGIGNVHRSRGDYAAALENYFSSLALSEQMKGPVGTTLGSIGLVRALQGDYVRALEYYIKAQKEFETTANDIEKARVLSLIGNAYYMQGNYESALISYQQALTLREQMNDMSGEGDVLAGIGSTFIRKKNYSDALDHFQKALRLFESGGNKESMGEVLTRVSEAFLLQNENTKALSAAESAVTIARQVNNADLLWYAQTLVGKVHQRLDHTTQAYQALTDAVSVVESLRLRPATAGGQHNSSLPYLSLVDYLMSQHRPGEAFDYAERAKVQTLFDLFRNSNASTTKGLSAAERKEEQRLAGTVASVEFQLDHESQARSSTEARRSSLTERLRQARAAYGDFHQKLYLTHRQLKLDRGELPPLKLEELRSLVPDTSTALLEYVVTENNTYLFVVTTEKAAKTRKNERPATIELRVYPLEVRNYELTSKVRQLEQQISERSPDYAALTRELYDLLIKPADDQIVLKTKLVVVPDGVLWRLPFEALQPLPDHFVADQMQISYAPSLTALREIQKQPHRSSASPTFVGFANPAFSKAFRDRVEVGYANTKLEHSLQQEEEIRQLSTIYGTERNRVFAGTNASEERFKVEASHAGVLHFSAPAIFDEASPMSSFIGLAAGNANQDDGFLQAREIVNLQTTAQLVVLSSAQTPTYLQGLTIPSESWSWFVAGSPLILINRWDIESTARAKLLSRFYFNLKTKSGAPLTKTAFLHNSMMSMRRSPEYQHPYYWASFALIGDAR